ncbi:MAG TPA: lytic transglycosylase domain-containing protein [Thermodesulfobacteriota bacterium]|nr:lytic transglycosylase domain-containing protein [Thermodesulfobacteriota bacterium]
MHYRKISDLTPEKLVQNYLWNYCKKEWLKLVVKGLVPRFRVCVFAVALLSPLMTAGILADGTNSRAFIAQNVRMLATTLPDMEKAFDEIDSLRKSISKVAYQGPEKAFIYAFLITKWSLAHRLDPNEVAGIILTESEFNHQAVSRRDARGLMQIHKPTWKMKDYFDSEENIKKGAEILAMYRWQFPERYLDRYSGGEPGYATTVTRNKKKIIANKMS